MTGVKVSTICVGLSHLQIQVINSDKIIINTY